MNTFLIFKHILNVGIRVAFADSMEKNIADTIGTLLGRMDALKRAKCVRRYLYYLLFPQNVWVVYLSDIKNVNNHSLIIVQDKASLDGINQKSDNESMMYVYYNDIFDPFANII